MKVYVCYHDMDLGSRNIKAFLDLEKAKAFKEDWNKKVAKQKKTFDKDYKKLNKLYPWSNPAICEKYKDWTDAQVEELRIDKMYKKAHTDHVALYSEYVTGTVDGIDTLELEVENEA